MNRSLRFAGICALGLAAVALAAGCEREARRLQQAKPTDKTEGPRQGELQPGQSGLGLPETVGGAFNDRNALQVSNGKRLFRWYNCNGCHAGGGGAYGPALMDDKWLYGSEPQNIYATILEGRPNGMPSFRGRIPDEQVWQLVAYVRSMSGLVAKDVAPSRSDAIQGAPSEEQRPREEPRNVSSPPS